MSDRVEIGWLERTLAGAATVSMLLGVHLAGCATEPRVSPRDLPLLLADNQAVVVSRDQIGRYRCASGAVLHCGGSSAASAQCVCSPLPIEISPSQ
jgi:hypothetical protein